MKKVTFDRNPEHKKTSILNASIKIIANDGVKASTKKISAESLCSEGTIFNHFKTKPDLINAVYLHIKNDIQNYVLKNHFKYPHLNFWELYLSWGLENTDAPKALSVIDLADVLTPETQEKSSEIFEEMLQRHDEILNVKEQHFLKILLCLAHVSIVKISEEKNDILKESSKKTALSMLCGLHLNKSLHLSSNSRKTKFKPVLEPILDEEKLPHALPEQSNVVHFLETSAPSQQNQQVREAMNA